MQQAHLDVFVILHTRCTADIRDHTKDKFYFVPVCIGEKYSPQICADALSSDDWAHPLQYVVLGQTGIPSDQSRCQACFETSKRIARYSLRSYVDQAYPEEFAFSKRLQGLLKICLTSVRFRSRSLRSGREVWPAFWMCWMIGVLEESVARN